MSQLNYKSLPRHRLSTVLEFIEDNLGTCLTIGELAGLLDLNPFRFARLFKHATGRTPHRYIVQRRIRRAQDLLAHSRFPISDIAYSVGFASQSHMTTVFRKEVGVTPRAFRRPNADRQCQSQMNVRQAPSQTARV